MSTKKQSMQRIEAAARIQHLDDHIMGNDGLNLLNDVYLRTASKAVLCKLQDWTSSSDSNLLWISGPWELQQATSTRAASLGVIAAALKLKVPFIAHFCEMPKRALVMEPEKAGMLGACYNLIRQLLQFNIADTELELSQARLQQLDGSEQSWTESLSLLYDLLHATPILPYCVIHNLSALECSTSAKWCNEFLDVLFRHQREAKERFNILFTTSGQSRILSSHIPIPSRLYTGESTRDVEKYGARLDLVPSDIIK